MSEVQVEIALLREQLKVANHRIQDLEGQTKAIFEQNTKIAEMNAALQTLVSEIKDIKSDVAENKKNISIINKRPAEEYNAIRSQVIVGIILGFVGYFIGKFK